ncbi:MAG: cytochrome c [Pseudomonadota bacterium]
MKKAILLLFVGIAMFLGGMAGYVYLLEQENEQTGMTNEDANIQVIRGKYLALAGNCAACHTLRGGAAYAGGRAVETPFGRVYSSNLTADAKTGLGNWNADDFWRAMHHGKSKDGRLLYPAFPYPNYTRITRADSDALFAYLKTVPAVEQPNREHELRFPYDSQVMLALWRTLYFRPGTFQPQAGKSAEWNRGAYLVQGLGHCNACHTSRDPLGGANTHEDLDGGMMAMSSWYAPSLTASSGTGLGKWQKQDIVDLLKTGVSQRGAVFGPMAEVVYRSLQHLTDSDVQAIAEYLKSLPRSEPIAQFNPSLEGRQEMYRVMEQGAKLYKKHCADCHGENGNGKAPAYPPLAGNHTLTMRSAVNPIRMVLNGGFPPGTAGNPRPYGMPPFRSVLNDDEVAAVVTYIRNSWGNFAGPVRANEVDRFRSAPVN